MIFMYKKCGNHQLSVFNLFITKSYRHRNKIDIKLMA